MVGTIFPDLSFPAFLSLETVRGCNARCTFCFLGTKQTPVQLMNDQVYRKIEREMVANRDAITRVTLNFMGEPLLDKQLEERVARLKSNGLNEVAVTTNAMLLTESRAEKLLRGGVDILRMSISTINPAKYEKIRRGLNLDQVLANAQKLFELRDRLGASTAIYVSMEKSSLISDEDIYKWREHWEGLARPGDMLKIDDCFDLNRTVEFDDNHDPCLPLMRTLMILHTGEVALCCGDFKEGAPRHILGRVTEASIAEIWNGEKARRYRQMHQNGEKNKIDICRGCRIWSPEAKKNVVIDQVGR